jgi:ADP-ribose pyrophosphatase YjhB (NUDIX family)
MTNDAEYLSQYDASRFPSPLVTVDSVLFTLHEGALCVLLVERANPPQQGAWGLPGGFIDLAHDDSTRATALRKLTEKTGISPSWLEQLDTFSGPDRDPRGWSLTIAWFALISWVECQPHIASVSDARWVPVAQLDIIRWLSIIKRLSTPVCIAYAKKRCTLYCRFTVCRRPLPMVSCWKPRKSSLVSRFNAKA